MEKSPWYELAENFRKLAEISQSLEKKFDHLELLLLSMQPASQDSYRTILKSGNGYTLEELAGRLPFYSVDWFGNVVDSMLESDVLGIQMEGNSARYKTSKRKLPIIEKIGRVPL